MKRFILLILAPVVIILFFLGITKSTPYFDYYNFIHRESVDEKRSVDILVNSGQKMTLYLCSKIKNPAMPKRGLAITALGGMYDLRAIPALEEILKNEREDGLIRAGALNSIYRLDDARGLELARQYKLSDAPTLRNVSVEILTDAGEDVNLPINKRIND